jgi:fucokinase
VDAFCGVDEKVRLEIISTSLLPRGSGMGTSSILGGCILAAIAKCVGMDIGCDDDNHLTQIVLMVEQLLTTGGGWQDQIGGLVGGFKLGTSKPNKFPLSTNVERIQVASSTVDQLNDRLVLVFTGQTRLAKNILQNVLRRWARRTEEILTTVQDLVNDAHRVTKALKEGDIDVVADCLNRYWSQKKVMAGADSGVEPPIVRSVLQSLLERDLISAGSLCGAGGGGFMVMLVKEGITADDVRSAVQKGELFDPSVRDFTWHDCRVSENGLKVTILDTKASAVDWFDIAWHEV